MVRHLGCARVPSRSSVSIGEWQPSETCVSSLDCKCSKLCPPAVWADYASTVTAFTCIGAVTTASAAALPKTTIKLMGWWQSLVFQAYISPQPEELSRGVSPAGFCDCFVLVTLCFSFVLLYLHIKCSWNLKSSLSTYTGRGKRHTAMEVIQAP